MSCGSGLERRCPACKEVAPPEASFCMNCGSDLAAPAAPAPTPAADLPEERRQVTVLFADLSGYTAVAEQMDPETLKGLVGRCLRRLGEEVERFGGTVDKYIGDNVMALFGAPVAHEDDAERAVRAALGMQDAMTEINEDLGARHDVSFALRVGLNTGEVVAGTIGSGYTVIGDTVNVASRLQAAGRPGSVTVGERTWRATREAVAYEPLEPLELKGKAEPVPAWEAADLITAQPAPRAETHLQSPLVGRDYELGLLDTLFEQVERDGRPHLVTLVGQAGVGKSRLLREIRKRLDAREDAPTFREGRCLPYGSSIVYWPLGEVIRAECAIVDADSSEEAWLKLRTGIDALLSSHGGESSSGEPSGRRAGLIGRLLGIEAAEVDAVDDDPQRMRENFFSAVRSVIEAMARRRPLVLGFEDIHWADGGMLDLIEYLAQWVRGPLLLVCLARDELLERRPSWGAGRRNASSMILDPLTHEQTQALVTALLPSGDGLVAPKIAERAGGNPLFAEEMVRLLSDERAEPGSELPDSVQALLAARLDSLEPFERRLMQQAAVVGRTFWPGSLEPIAEAEGRDLGRALVALEEKDLVVPSEGPGLAGEREYAFKHVLIRDVAYGMLPKAVRCQKHWEVGRFIEGRAGDRSDEFGALLAEHYARAAALGEETGLRPEEQAPIAAKALHYLEGAADSAAALYSNQEAFNHYEAARHHGRGAEPALLARIGEKQGDVALRMGRVDAAIAVWEECLDFQRREENLERVGDLHRKLGAGLWHKGETKRAIEHYQKGTNLLKDGPPSLELVRLYEEAASLYMHTGDNMLAIYASEKALRLAERLGETRAAGRAHGIFGRVFGRIGDMEKARENLEKSVDLAREADRTETIRALLTLGYHLEMSEADYAAAIDAYSEALGLAQQVGDLPAQVELRSALALIAAYRADWDVVRDYTEASARLAEAEGLVGKLAFPYALRGLLHWREGDWDASVQAARRAHELADQAGWSEVSCWALMTLSLALRDRGDYRACIDALDRALDVCERAGLIAQSIQAMGERALALALGGRTEQARDAAEEAGRLASRLHYPVGDAAALEAQGAVAGDPLAGAEQLRESRELWTKLGRPLNAARCDLWIGRLLTDADPAKAAAALDAAAAEFDRLGVRHLAERARELSAA
jgi:class 3 adenylate cyclase/tetratricopeptide (TPR) repeat protein